MKCFVKSHSIIHCIIEVVTKAGVKLYSMIWGER